MDFPIKGISLFLFQSIDGLRDGKSGYLTLCRTDARVVSYLIIKHCVLSSGPWVEMRS